jgi:hypothetical protein
MKFTPKHDWHKTKNRPSSIPSIVARLDKSSSAACRERQLSEKNGDFRFATGKIIECEFPELSFSGGHVEITPDRFKSPQFPVFWSHDV